MMDPTHEQVVQFVRGHSRPFVTTAEVTDEFDTVSRRTINGRLNDLHDRGEIGKRKIGRGSVVWFLQESAEKSASSPSSDSQ
jgi:hypothetical protein